MCADSVGFSAGNGSSSGGTKTNTNFNKTVNQQKQVPDAGVDNTPANPPAPQKKQEPADNGLKPGEQKPAENKKPSNNNPPAPGNAATGNNPSNPSASGWSQSSTGGSSGSSSAGNKGGSNANNRVQGPQPQQTWDPSWGSYYSLLTSQTITSTTSNSASGGGATAGSTQPLQQPITFTTTITVPVAGPVTAAQAAAGQTTMTASLPVSVTVTPGASVTVTQTPTGATVMTMTPAATITVTPIVTATTATAAQALASPSFTQDQWNEIVKHEIAPKLKLGEWALNGAFVMLDQGQATLEAAGQLVVGASVAARNGQFAFNGTRKLITAVTALANGDVATFAGNALDATRIWRSGAVQMDRLMPVTDVSILEDGRAKWFSSKNFAENIWSSDDYWKWSILDNPVGRTVSGWVNAANANEMYMWAKAKGGVLMDAAGKANIIFETVLATGSIIQNYIDWKKGRVDPVTGELRQPSLYTATRSSIASVYDWTLDIGPAQFWFAQLSNDGGYYLGTGMDYASSNSARHVSKGWFATGEALTDLWSLDVGGPNGNTNGDWFDDRIKLVNGISNDGQSVVMWGQALTKDPRLILLNGGWAYADGSATQQYNAYRLDANGNHIRASDWKPMTMIGFLADQMSTWGVGTSATAAGIDMETADKISAMRTSWADYKLNGQDWWRYYGGGIDILAYSQEESALIRAVPVPAGTGRSYPYEDIWPAMTPSEQATGLVPDRYFDGRITELKLEADIRKFYAEDLQAWRDLPLVTDQAFTPLPSQYCLAQGDKAIQSLEAAYPTPTPSGLRDALILDTKVHYARLYADAVAMEGGDGQQAFEQRLADFGVSRTDYDYFSQTQLEELQARSMANAVQ